MPMTSYEKMTVSMSLIALIASCWSIFGDRIASKLSTNTPKVFVENKVYVFNRLGNLNTNPTITIANEGASEITLGRIEGDIRLQSGGSVKLTAESFNKNNSSFYLREVSIKPNQTWSERVNITEEIPANKEEEISTLEENVFESINEQSSQKDSGQIAFLKAFLPFLEAMPDDSKNKLDAKKRRAKWNEVLQQIQEQRAPISAAPPILLEAKKLFDRNIARIEKGRHILKLALFDRSDTLIWEGNFDFILYEKQVLQFQKSFDNFGKAHFDEKYGYSPSGQPGVLITFHPKK